MEVHILNGDALKSQFPSSLPGDLIVMRECLVDGDPQGTQLPELIDHRIRFFQHHYHTAPEVYRRKTVTEIDRIVNLPVGTRVNLWFEDDLFCQVNLWFTAHLLHTVTEIADVTLVRPDGDIRYGFGGMDESALLRAYDARQPLNAASLKQLAALWPLYQQKDHEAMIRLADNLLDRFPFLPAAVAANRDRYPSVNFPGRPQSTLQELISEMGSKDFGPVFRAFNERESIYGYGDLQVKRLFDELTSEV